MQELPDAALSWMCPRCGDLVNGFPASSRTDRGNGEDPVSICPACGSDETFIHESGDQLPQPDEWPVQRRFGIGGERVETEQG